MLKVRLSELKNENKLVNKGIIKIKETLSRNKLRALTKTHRHSHLRLDLLGEDVMESKSNSIGSPLDTELFYRNFALELNLSIKKSPSN